MRSPFDDHGSMWETGEFTGQSGPEDGAGNPGPHYSYAILHLHGIDDEDNDDYVYLSDWAREWQDTASTSAIIAADRGIGNKDNPRSVQARRGWAGGVVRNDVSVSQHNAHHGLSAQLGNPSRYSNDNLFKEEDGADLAVGERPVDHVFFDEGGIGHEHVYAVEPSQTCASRADFGDAAVVAIDLHGVAEADGAIEHEDEAGDEVVEDGLGAEAEPDGDRAAEEGEHGDGDLHGLQGHQQDKDQKDIKEDFLDGGSGADIEGRARDESLADGAGEAAGDPDAQGEDEHRNDDLVEVNRGFADGQDGK